MAFLKGLKRAFGISDDQDDDFDMLSGEQRTPIVNPYKKTAQHNTDKSVGEERGERKTANASVTDMPNELVAGIRAYAEQVRDEALQEAEKQWQQKQDEADRRLMEASASANDTTQRFTELKERLQQAEAHKRTAEAKVKNLQAKVAQLEADYEQFELENKSLLNKIKVMQFKGDDGGDMLVDEVARLNTELSGLRKKSMQDEERIEKLQEQLAKAETLLREAENNDNNATKQEIEEKFAEEYKQKQAFTNQLLNNLRADDAKKVEEIEKLNKTIDELTAQNTELNAKYTELQRQNDAEEHEKQIKALNKEIESLHQQLDENRAVQVDMNELQEQFKRVEEFKTKKNNEIASLKAKIEENKTQYETEQEKLRQQIKDLEEHRGKLMREIDNLNQKARDLATRHNKRDIETANRIDDLKSQLGTTVKMLEQYKEGNEKYEKTAEQLYKANDEVKKLKQELKKANDLLKAKQAVADTDIADSAAVPVGDKIQEVNEQPKPSQPAKETASSELSQPARENVASEGETASLAGIDDDIDDIDWLMPSPPSQPKPEVEEVVDNQDADAKQMTLF